MNLFRTSSFGKSDCKRYNQNIKFAETQRNLTMATERERGCQGEKDQSGEESRGDHAQDMSLNSLVIYLIGGILQLLVYLFARLFNLLMHLFDGVDTGNFEIKTMETNLEWAICRLRGKDRSLLKIEYDRFSFMLSSFS